MSEGQTRSGGPEGVGRLRKVFVVGCPRSGTTWLQLLLAQHSEVQTARETYVFRRYLAGLERGWDWDNEGGMAKREPVGLAPLLEEEAFWGWARGLSDLVFATIRGDADDVTTVVEKTPAHVLDWPLILRLYPDALFLHLIRDPRSVVSSLIHASRSWGEGWASQSPVDGARTWKRFVARGREIAGATSNYREVIYERLLEDTPGELGAILEWLALPHDEETCVSIAEACRIDRLRSRSTKAVIPWSAKAPSGFFRKGKSDSWRDELSHGQLRTIEYIAGDLMTAYGYARVTHSKRRSVRHCLREGLEWRFERFANRVRRWLEGL